MRVDQYEALFAKGQQVRLDTKGGSRLLIAPPDPDRPDAGFTPETQAGTVVELIRALQAWLAVHKRLFPWWHHRYRAENPGGLPTLKRGKVIDELEDRVERMSADRQKLRAVAAFADALVAEDPVSAMYGYQIKAIVEGTS